MLSYIGLGGNLGAVEATFRSALKSLDATPSLRVNRVSSFYRTEPMGDHAGETYLNAVAELDFAGTPLELLDVLQAVELEHGRERPLHWGPRTLDLDLLLCGDLVLDHPRLTLPHPGCWYRRFVLDPLAEIAPHLLHPIKLLTIEELRTRLLPRPLPVGICGSSLSERQQVLDDLSQHVLDIQPEAWHNDSDHLPALLLWLGPSKGVSSTFDELPLVPRLDLTRFPEGNASAARHVLRAALGQ